MTIFYICRHGQTENNKNKRLSGWIDTPLTDEGIQNAAMSATKLRTAHIDKVVSSDLGRAYITAYLILQQLGSSLVIEPSKDLREINYGDLANTPLTSYPTVTALENATFVLPNGESLQQMQQRVIACVERLGQTYPEKTILLTAHDGTINAIYAHFTNQNIGEVDAASHNAHDFVAKFVYDNGNITSFEEVVL